MNPPNLYFPGGMPEWRQKPGLASNKEKMVKEMDGSFDKVTFIETHLSRLEPESVLVGSQK